jgi:pyruvate dehydrogenase E1 component alpha subunit
MTPEDRYLPVPRLAVRAAGYGIESATADGNDVADVHAVVRSALDHARGGGGPVLVEAFTYRMHGHGAHDAQRYVPAHELEEWAARDPLAAWRRRAEGELGWSDADQDGLESRVAGEVEEALRDALAAPYPPADGLAASVFAG